MNLPMGNSITLGHITEVRSDLGYDLGIQQPMQ
jgi:hypothetical protein